MLALHTGPLRERRETFARWSSGGSPPQRPHPTNSGRRNVRRHACRSCTTRSRERVGATTYRCRSGIATAGPIGPCPRTLARAPTNIPMETRKRNRRVGEDASDRGAPYVFTTCGSETISAEPEAFLAQNRDARRRGRRQGRQRWSESANRSTGRKRPTPATSSHRSAHGVVKTPSAPVSRSCLGLGSQGSRSGRNAKRLGRHTIRWVPVSESVDEQKSAARIFRSSARQPRKRSLSFQQGWGARKGSDVDR